MKETPLVLTLLLASCGGSAPYGSFVTGRDRAQAAIAADAANKLAAAFPAAGRAIRFAHDAHDAFGRPLATELRKKGFAIRTVPAAGELLVLYVVDTIKGTGMLRATIYVRGRAFSRAYAAREGGLHPVGPWSVGVLHGS